MILWGELKFMKFILGLKVGMLRYYSLNFFCLYFDYVMILCIMKSLIIFV